MRLIAHRGNLVGPNTSRENLPAYVDIALSSGYDAEIDIWLIDNLLFLGHDKPQFEVTLEWLITRSNLLWIHAKTCATLGFLIGQPDLNCFFHDTDAVTLTSHNFLWTFPGGPLHSRSVNVMPEKSDPGLSSIKRYCDSNFYAICTDFPEKFADIVCI